MSSRHISVTPRTPPLSPAHHSHFSTFHPPPLPPPPQTSPTSAATLDLLESKTNKSKSEYDVKQNVKHFLPSASLSKEFGKSMSQNNLLEKQAKDVWTSLSKTGHDFASNQSSILSREKRQDDTSDNFAVYSCTVREQVILTAFSTRQEIVTSMPSTFMPAQPAPPPPPPPPPLPISVAQQEIQPPPPPPPAIGGGALPPPPPPPPMLSSAGVPVPPPPLLPGIKSGLGPPPPPPSLGGARQVLRKQPIKPGVPMKPLFWKRIHMHVQPSSSSACKVLWDSLKEPKIDVEQFENDFSKVERKKEEGAQKSKSSKRTKQKVVNLLDNKRSQAIGILLSTLRVSIGEIKQALYKMDLSILDDENLKSLYEIRATKEELSSIKAYLQEHPDAVLDKPENFLLDVSKIVCYEERLCCMISRTSISDSLMEVGETLTNFRLMCEDLQTNSEVHNILSLVLAFGNHMNGGNLSRGQADGFELEILTKLKDVKSKDHTFTLLHYLVQVYLAMFDKNAGTLMSKFPLPEPTDLQTASQLSFDDLNADLKGIEKKLDECGLKIAKVVKESEPNLRQPFEKTMKTFLEQSKSDLKEQFQVLEECNKKYDMLLQFFYQRSVSLSSQDFFELWSKFSLDFKVLWKKRQQFLAKQMYEKTQKRVRIPKKPISLTGLKLKLAASSKKTTSK